VEENGKQKQIKFGAIEHTRIREKLADPVSYPAGMQQVVVCKVFCADGPRVPEQRLNMVVHSN